MLTAELSTFDSQSAAAVPKTQSSISWSFNSAHIWRLLQLKMTSAKEEGWLNNESNMRDTNRTSCWLNENMNYSYICWWGASDDREWRTYRNKTLKKKLFESNVTGIYLGRWQEHWQSHFSFRWQHLQNCCCFACSLASDPCNNLSFFSEPDTEQKQKQLESLIKCLKYQLYWKQILWCGAETTFRSFINSVNNTAVDYRL